MKPSLFINFFREPKGTAPVIEAEEWRDFEHYTDALLQISANITLLEARRRWQYIKERNGND